MTCRPADIGSVAEACGRDATLIYVLAYTGLRFGEAAALRVRDDPLRARLSGRENLVDVAGRPVMGETKTYQRREVPLPQFVVD